MKRGQVSVFIIIAIIIVAAGGSIAYILNNRDNDFSKNFFSSQGTKTGFDSLKASIINCMDKISYESLDTISLQGGYYEKPEKNLDLGFLFIPYYYYEGKYLMPEKTKVENEISKYINDNFPLCIKNIDSDFNIEIGNMNTKTAIKKGEVGFILNAPVTITKDNNVVKLELKDAPLNKKSYIYESMELARYITDSHKQDPKLLCISCVAQLAEERNLYVNAFDLNDSSVLYIISENITSAETHYFEFVNKYPKRELEIAVIPGLPAGAYQDNEI
ncbi:MAG: hypothetical protein Q8N99_07715 [Nanoarchaeota archaeon]|nr:hypothetical protein [Nanoarchaeota archaeon]